jgi:hypothetical protein
MISICTFIDRLRLNDLGTKFSSMIVSSYLLLFNIISCLYLSIKFFPKTICWFDDGIIGIVIGALIPGLFAMIYFGERFLRNLEGYYAKDKMTRNRINVLVLTYATLTNLHVFIVAGIQKMN